MLNLVEIMYLGIQRNVVGPSVGSLLNNEEEVILLAAPGSMTNRSARMLKSLGADCNPNVDEYRALPAHG